MVTSISYKDLRLQFDQALKAASEHAKENDVAKSDFSQEAPEIYNLVEVSPASAVLAAWAIVEDAAKGKVQEIMPERETFRDPLQRPIVYLEHKRCLTPSAVNSIHILHQLRDQAAHAKLSKAVSRTNAIRYIDQAIAIRKQVDAILEIPKVQLRALTMLILEINALIDSGKYDNITVDEVCQWIKNENIIQSLATRAGEDVDLSVLLGDRGVYSSSIHLYHSYMKGMLDAHGCSGERKWGVKNKGLCLLLAWANEMLQQGSGWYPNDECLPQSNDR